MARYLEDSRITESSGLARSTFGRSLLFTHNDNDGVPALFAVAESGRTRAVLRLEGARAVDWEDVSTGPGHTLWIGDIGDNDRDRARVWVYRISETRRLRPRAVRWARFPLVYPDGPRDAEALMVHPRTGRLFVVSKQRDGAGVYRAPRRLLRDRSNVLQRVGSAPASITAAAFDRRGRRVVMTDYRTAFLRRWPSGRTTRRLALPETPQGESIEFGRGSRALLRGSEGERSPVLRVPLS
ncbi:hypothetical protein [Nocardioides pacificus]